MTLKALIFDVDGTLANTERDGHLVAFNLAFAELGLDSTNYSMSPVGSYASNIMSMITSPILLVTI